MFGKLVKDMLHSWQELHCYTHSTSLSLSTIDRPRAYVYQHRLDCGYDTCVVVVCGEPGSGR